MLFWVSLVYALVHLPAFVAATPWIGLRGAIWSIVGAGVVYIWLNVWMLRKTLDVSYSEVVVQLRRPLTAALLMVGAVWLLVTMVPSVGFSQEGSWLSLVLKMSVGALVFSAAQYLIWRLEGRPDGIERRVLQILSR